MKWQYDGYNWLVRLEKGELLTKNLKKLVIDQKINGAWISGLGGALWADLGYYNLDSKEYQWKKINNLLEITNLQGNVAWQNGEPILHIHGTFSDREMNAYGGHIKELAVGGTCEVLIHRWNKDQLNRLQNDEIGLALLDV